jgi:hypothetical protein
MNRPLKKLFETGRMLRQSLAEQQACIADVYARMAPCLRSPDGTPPDYRVAPGAIPRSFRSWRRNLFSTLFHATYLAMDYTEPRRMLYGRIIHLYRIWVTSADNLLDHEDKIVVPIEMAGTSRVMRQVIALMAADRVLAELLDEAVAGKMISAQSARRLMQESLRRLLPSAAQEAQEEGGIRERPDPEHVLDVIHRLKTGLLFHVAFAAPEILEPAPDLARIQCLKDALMQIGLGCQILDDIRDMARDLLERRHNYVLSWMTRHQPEALKYWEGRATAVPDRLYLHTADAVAPAAERGFRMIRSGLLELGEAGLDYGPEATAQMANLMFTALDIPELQNV